MQKRGSNKSCPKGTIERIGYVKKNGSKVKSKCIRSTSQSGKKRSDIDKKIIAKKKAGSKQAREKFGTPKCKKGDILREGYHKRSHSRSAYVKKDGSKISKTNVKSSWTPPVCIKSETGKPHGTQLFVLEKGTLEKFGYSNVGSMTRQSRQTALSKAITEIKPLSLMRRLNALAVLNKDKNPKLSKIFKDDSEWVKTTKAYQNRPTAKKGSKK